MQAHCSFAFVRLYGTANSEKLFDLSWRQQHKFRCSAFEERTFGVLVIIEEVVMLCFPEVGVVSECPSTSAWPPVYLKMVWVRNGMQVDAET